MTSGKFVQKSEWFTLGNDEITTGYPGVTENDVTYFLAGVKNDVVQIVPPSDDNHDPNKGKCDWCGNKSGLKDRRGACVSCGAPL